MQELSDFFYSQTEFCSVIIQMPIYVNVGIRIIGERGACRRYL